MPKQSTLAVIALIGLTAAALSSSLFDFKTFFRLGKPSRASKIEILSSVKGATLRHTAKISGPLEVSIESSQPPPVAVGQVVSLRGIVSSSELIDRVDIVWSVGPEFEVISGATVDQLVNVGPESPKKISITVKPLRAGRAMVHLKASSKKAGISFSQVAQWATERESKDFIMSKDSGKREDSDSSQRQKVFH